MEKIKIGQIGIGHNHAEEKMKSLRRLTEDFEIVGIAEPDERWRKERGSLEGYRNLPVLQVEELLDMPGLQAVLVESDVEDLVHTAQQCVERGLHIHLDKPVGRDLGSLRRMLDTAKAGGLIVQVGYMYRYNPAVMACLDAVKAGELGRIFHIDAQMSTEHWAGYRKWLGTFPGGSMYIFGCHMIDLIVYLMGEPEEVTGVLSRTGKEEIDAEDNDVALLRYPQGTCFVRTSSVEVNGFGRRQFVVCGERGTIEVKPLENPMCYARSESDSKQVFRDHRYCVGFPVPSGRYDIQLKEFARMIRGEIENPFSYEHEYLVQQITLKACGL